MVKHHRRKTRTRKHVRRGGGYGFGGSILSDAGGANAGNVQWNPDTSQDCGIDANRGGNGAFAGGRRKRRTKKSKKSKRHTRRRRGGAVSNESLAGRGGNNTMAGGSYAPVSSAESRATQLNPALIQSAPRTGYTFNGSGVAGTADTVRLNG